MGLRFHNTLSGRTEPFETLEPGVVRIYTCGPTVYDRAHIGNFRAFVWEDLLRRYLKWRGFEVVQVMNITDVDDRTIAAANERGVTLEEVTGPVTEAFFEDWDTLGLERVEHNPYATEHVPQMIELVRRLEDAGYTYERDGSVYFAIARYPGYGRLIKLDPAELRTPGRAEGDEEYSKDDPRDFVLWKGGGREPEGAAAAWDSPWGRGRPGWHLECSAMAMEYLGDQLDIHTGGVDNIFPHHVNEMAQSEAATGASFARLWMHASHLLVDGGKMSKSLGNFYTVPSLLDKGYRASGIRYLLLSAHHRTHLNFTLESLDQAEKTLDRLFEFRRRLLAISDALPEGPAAAEVDRALAVSSGAFVTAFTDAMDDDLNVSGALAAVFNMVREVNAELDRAADAGEAVSGMTVQSVLEALDDFDRVFGVLSLRASEEVAVDEDLARWVEDRIREREEARAVRDWDLADSVRAQLEKRGVVLEDTSAGTRWKLGGSPARHGAS
jgi:cysteinyl-tRNA synthetase